MTYPVQLFRYDLSQGMARMYSMQMCGTQIDAIWHTSVVVHGREFYFDGGVGIVHTLPGTTRFGVPVARDDLGATDKGMDQVGQWAAGMKHQYGNASYSLLDRNCNHFTDDMARFLFDGRGISPEITEMIGRLLATPLGAMMRPTLEAMTSQGAAQAQHQSFAPQERAAPPAVAAPAAAPSMFGGPQLTGAEEEQLNDLIEALTAAPSADAVAAIELIVATVRSCMAFPSEPSLGMMSAAVVKAVAPAATLAGVMGFAERVAGGEANLVLQAPRANLQTFETVELMLGDAADEMAVALAAA
jgi:hypothetical protein